MNRPVLLLRLGRDRSGRLDCAPDLATAATAAAGAPVRLVTAGPDGTVPEWAATLARSRPEAVVLVVDRSTRTVGELLRAALAAHGVEAARAEAVPDRIGLVHCEGPGADLTARSEPDRIYRSGAVPLGRAAELGVPVGAGTVEELRHLDGRALAPMAVPLIGGPETDWRSFAELLREAGLDLSRVRPHPRLPAELVESETARALAAFASGGVTVECDPERTGAPRLRSALSALAAHRIVPSVRVRSVPGRAWRPERLAGLLRAAPDAEAAADLATLRGLSAQGALTGCPRQTRVAAALREDRRRLWAGLERASGGRYAALPITAGAHDLWWEHEEPVEAHQGWIGSVVSAGGTVWTRGQAAAAAAHVAVRDLDQVAAAGRYGDERFDRPVLAWIDSAADILADVDDAWSRGVLRRRLFDPARFLAGLCRLGHGDCPSASGRQLLVAADGAVRAGRSGPVVGKVGDDLSALRAAIRALPATERGCRCRPAGMEPPERPWLGRVLDAAAALSELGGEHRDLFEPGALESLRASGCGGPLTHGHGSAARWPAGAAMLCHRDHYYLRTRDRIHRLTPSMAAVVELRLDRPDDTSELLARSHRLSAAAAAKAVAAAESALAAAGALDTRETPA